MKYLLLLLLIFAGCFIEQASAGCNLSGNVWTCANEGDARGQLAIDQAYPTQATCDSTYAGFNPHPVPADQGPTSVTNDGTYSSFTEAFACAPTGGQVMFSLLYRWPQTAPTCDANGPDLTNFQTEGTDPVALVTGCSDGCEYVASPDFTEWKVQANGHVRIKASSWRPTGTSCAVGRPAITPPPPDGRLCEPDGAGGTVCVDPANGKKCITTAQGFSACWNPTDAGPVVSGDRSKGATASPVAPAPGLTPPLPANRPGENFTPGTGGGTVINNNNSTNIIGLNNSGTPAPNAPPVTGDGTPVAGGQTPTGDPTCGVSGKPACEKGCGQDKQPACDTVAGGGDCVAPPACTGDAVQCYQSVQQWKAACALSDGGTGTNPDPNADGGPSDSSGAQQDVGSSTDTSSQLDQSGYAFDRSCPNIPSFDVFGHTYHIDISNVCTVGRTIGYLLVLLSLLAGAKIATGSV